MHGFKEDLINVVIRDIEEKWSQTNGDVTYFVGLVRGSRLTAEDIRTYRRENHKKMSTCVDIVFAKFVNEEEGGAK